MVSRAPLLSMGLTPTPSAHPTSELWLRQWLACGLRFFTYTYRGLAHVYLYYPMFIGLIYQVDLWFSQLVSCTLSQRVTTLYRPRHNGIYSNVRCHI